MNNQSKKTTIRGITKIKNEWKNHVVTINQVELENGDISGTFEGELNMVESKLSNNQLLKYLDKKFDAIDKKFDKKFDDMEKKFDKKFDDMEKKFDKKFDDMEKKFDKKFDVINKKLDLIINCPTIQREIDHNAWNEII